MAFASADDAELTGIAVEAAEEEADLEGALDDGKEPEGDVAATTPAADGEGGDAPATPADVNEEGNEKSEKVERKVNDDEPTEDELVKIWASEDPQEVADILKTKFRQRGCPVGANVEKIRKFMDDVPETLDYLKPYLTLRNLICESNLPFLQYLGQEFLIKVEGMLVSHVWRNLLQKMRAKNLDAHEVDTNFNNWVAEKNKPIDWFWWGKCAAIALTVLLAVAWTTIHFEDSYTYWVLPVLFIQIVLVSISLFVGNIYMRQVMLSIVGMHWCLMALWVNTLINIWYRDYNYLDPPAMNKYNPFCDISSWARCSRVFVSPHFHILRQLGLVTEGGWMDFANPTLGVLFYLSQIFYQVFRWLEFPGMHILSFGSASLVGLYSVWFAYVVIFLIGDFCIGCFVLCAVNVALLGTVNTIVNQETEEAEKSSFGRFKYD